MPDPLKATWQGAQALTDELGEILAERDRLMSDREVAAKVAALVDRYGAPLEMTRAVTDLIRDLMASAGAELLDERQRRITAEHQARHARGDETTVMEATS